MVRNYVTIKLNGKYHRILKIEEGKDDSIYIKSRWKPRPELKFSYHEEDISGKGFRRHIKTEHQKIKNFKIGNSARYSKSKLKDKNQVFFTCHFHDKLNNDREIDKKQLNSKDLIFDINEPISKYEILVSINREDLLKETEFIKTKKLNIQSGNFYITLYKKTN